MRSHTCSSQSRILFQKTLSKYSTPAGPRVLELLLSSQILDDRESSHLTRTGELLELLFLLERIDASS